MDPSKLTGDTPDERYVRRVLAEELVYLASSPADAGERYPNIIPTTIRRESLRLSNSLVAEARAQIDVAAVVMEAAARNGSHDLYGEPHLMKAID